VFRTRILHRTAATLPVALLISAGGCLRAPGIAPIAIAPPMLDPAALSAGQTPEFTVETIPVPDELRRPYNHTSCIVALPDGALLVAWGAGTRELAIDTAILLARRAPEGTWDTTQVVADFPGFPDANCTLFRDPGGDLHLYWAAVPGENFCQAILLARDSGDDGETWSDPRPQMPAFCTLLKNKPIVLRSGRWVLPAYTQAVYASQFWTSDDAGATWQAGDWLLGMPSNLQPAVVERSDGTLLALMRRGGAPVDAHGVNAFTWQGDSSDGGVTWSLSERDELLNPDSGLDLLRLESGLLVLACNDSATLRTPLVVRASLDEGVTWLPPRVVAEIDASDGRSQLSYPSLAESADGRVHLTWSDNLKSIAHAEFNLAWMLSP